MDNSQIEHYVVLRGNWTNDLVRVILSEKYLATNEDIVEKISEQLWSGVPKSTRMIDITYSMVYDAYANVLDEVI